MRKRSLIYCVRRSFGLALILLAGCATQVARTEAAGPVRAAPDWRGVATAADRTRIGNWREAFVKGLAAARSGGHAAEIDREGALLAPDAALPNPRPPAGAYRCRVIKLGANGTAMADYTVYPSFDCRIDDEGDLASFSKLTGSQRPVGILFGGADTRLIFLGTMMLGDERRALDYGDDPDRDMAGAVERIGAGRWRLILPYPRFESIMDVIELVPAAQG